MNEASIILLLGSGAILVSTALASRPNSNAYPGLAGRRSQNYNSNVNTNIVSGAAPRHSDDESNPALEDISRNLYAENDPKTAALASSAAEATMSIMKALTAEFTDTAAASVAEAVSRIITSRSTPIFTRRHYNVNSNTNTNIIRRGGEKSDGNSLGTESGDQGLGYDTMDFGLHHGYGNDLTTQAIDEVTSEPSVDEEEDNKVTSLDRLVEVDNEEIEAETLADKAAGSGWPRANRRNLNFIPIKFRPNHRPSSTNSNSNSNSNNFRRSINNRMSRRYRSRRN